MTIIASATVCRNSFIRARRVGSTRVSAKPKNSANTTSGSIALCAAAAIALLGMIAAIQSPTPGWAAVAAALGIVARSFSSSAGSRGSSDSSIGATIGDEALRRR